MKKDFMLDLAQERECRAAIRRNGTTLLHLGAHRIAIRTTLFSHDAEVRVRDITDPDCLAPPVIYRGRNQPGVLYALALEAIERHINGQLAGGVA